MRSTERSASAYKEKIEADPQTSAAEKERFVKLLDASFQWDIQKDKVIPGYFVCGLTNVGL